MNIGFDAKRAFHNMTGLGNYSRTLIESLANFYPNNAYYLFNPKKSHLFSPTENNIKEINPKGSISKMFPALWRSKLMISDIERLVDIYHGLSNELPFGIHESKVKKVVTIHDLIFEHYPDQYNHKDRIIYRTKFQYACKHADYIIAISEATKKDLIETYDIPKEKIEVCYQSCDQRFYAISELNQVNIAEKYQLNTPYFLSVGSLIERKNLLNTVKAFHMLRKEHTLKFLVIGKGNSPYKLAITDYINKNKLESDIIFLEDHYPSQEILNDLPLLYQNAIALVYPSIKEGFGIPVIEAMASGTAVVTSKISSMFEATGDAAQCINPLDINELYIAMKKLVMNPDFRELQIKKGKERAQLFNHENTCEKVMNLYKKIK
jgi:glycosyltransferase involved in cell wall biosynthesis